MATAAVHTIKMKQGTQPKRAKMRKMAFAYEQKFAQTFEDMMTSGRIQPCNSPWASAVRIVGKPDGSIRTTIDYKHINGDIENVMRFMTDIFR
jgi:hypothetical protein